MSSRIGSVASRPTCVRRTDPMGSSAVSGASGIVQLSDAERQLAQRRGQPWVGTTIGVAVVSVVAGPDDDPTGTIGGGGGVVDVVAVSWFPTMPSGITIGFFESPAVDVIDGGQSTAVGGQLSVLLSEESESDGGAHPEEAPKSPGELQSACAATAGMTAAATTDVHATTRKRRNRFIC
jgi:hypothetical protein